MATNRAVFSSRSNDSGLFEERGPKFYMEILCGQESNLQGIGGGIM
jgi:hypothetical protein